MSKLKKISLIIISTFYIIAGTNHFINPASYLSIIPPWLPAHDTINLLAGIFEIGSGILLWFPATRSVAAWTIMSMLALFMPAHIYMIQHAPMQMGNNTITPLTAWLRIPIQALLIWWAYSFTTTKKK